MKALPAAAALIAAPLAAAPPSDATDEAAQVTAATEAFLAAIGNPDRRALAAHMIAEGMIFVHNRMDPMALRIDAVPVARHLDQGLGRQGRFIEQMAITKVLLDGVMAQVWGPDRFFRNSELLRCGANVLSLVKTESGWKAANASFTMEPPARCPQVGAPGGAGAGQ
ncbi:MAG: hypothetical protein ACK4E5_06850 [Erythrobacter cryptus]